MRPLSPSTVTKARKCWDGVGRGVALGLQGLGLGRTVVRPRSFGSSWFRAEDVGVKCLLSPLSWGVDCLARPETSRRQLLEWDKQNLRRESIVGEPSVFFFQLSSLEVPKCYCIACKDSAL